MIPESSTQNLATSFTTLLSISSHSIYNVPPNQIQHSPCLTNIIQPSSCVFIKRWAEKWWLKRCKRLCTLFCGGVSHSQTHLDVPSHPRPRRTRSDQELIDGFLAEAQEHQQSQRTADVNGVPALPPSSTTPLSLPLGLLPCRR